MSKTHHIKIKECFYQAILSGEKTFEIRYDDRGYQKGDTLYLKPVNEDGQSLAAELGILEVEVTYITDWEQRRDFVVMAIKVKEKPTLLDEAFEIITSCKQFIPKRKQSDECLMEEIEEWQNEVQKLWEATK